MDTKRLCVYNETTGSFLSVGATIVDTTVELDEARQRLVDVGSLTAESSFWMKPFKAVPLARIVSPFDIVYLDEDLRVVMGMELSPAVERAPFEGHAASALVLPLHTVYSSRTYPGDQLIICAAEELVRHLASVPIGGVPVSGPELRKSSLGAMHRSGGPGPVLVEDPAGKREVPIQPPERKEKAEVVATVERKKLEFQAEEIDAVISQVRSWTAAIERSRATVPFVAPPTPELQNREIAPTEASGNHGVTPPPLPDRPKRTAPSIPRLDEIEEVEIESGGPDDGIDPSSQEIESVISQVMRWAEETGRPPATASLAASSASSAARRATPPAERLRGNGGFAAAGSTDRFDEQRRAMEPGVGDAGDRVQKRDSWITRLLHSAKALGYRLMGVFRLRSASRVRKSLASAAKPAASIGASMAIHVKRLQAATDELNAKAKASAVTEHMNSMRVWFTRWLGSDNLAPRVRGPIERRRSKRHPLPGLVAYYWTGGTPQAHQVGDISTTGFYLLTKERWLPDTMIRMTLQRQGSQGNSPVDVISVISKVVRCGLDGVGYEFVHSDALESSRSRVRHGHRFA